MSSFNRNELFHPSGPKGMLDYLQSRLDAGDLSSAEALALLSALHEELGQMEAADRHVYQAYSRLMDSLRTAKPDVYDYVVSTWGRRQGGNARDARKMDEISEEVEDVQSPSREPAPSNETAKFNESRLEEFETGGEHGGLGEAGEARSEKGITGQAEAGEVEEEKNEPEQEELEEEPEEKQPDEENEPEEAEVEEETKQDTTSEPETELRQENEKPEAENSEADGNTGTQGKLEELEAQPEGIETEADPQTGEHQAIEWPQLEEPGPEEPIEGEEGEAPPVD